MLRIHFTAEDLARTRIAEGSDPAWEIVLCLHILRGGQGGLAFEEWRRDCRRRVPSEARALAPLAPVSRYFPDYLTPAEGHLDLESRIDTVLSTPRTRLRAETERLASGRELPGWVRDVGEGRPEALRQVGDAMRACHRAFIAPYAPLLRAHIDADRAAQARLFLGGGVDALLDGLHPSVRWQPPVLNVDYPVDRDVRLGGRGLLLQPSLFCWRKPVTFADDSLRPVLVYPVEPLPGWTAAPGRAVRTPRRVSRLVGSTRAAVLEMSASACTTGELADRLGVTAPAATHHTAVLREAGLIHSHRDGKHVLHTLTPLGEALLESRVPPPRSGA